MPLCKNVGSVDRIVRAVIGVVALAVAFSSLRIMEGGIAGIIAAAVGVIMLLTAAIGVCPLYVPLKLSTCKALRK